MDHFKDHHKYTAQHCLNNLTPLHWENQDDSQSEGSSVLNAHSSLMGSGSCSRTQSQSTSCCNTQSLCLRRTQKPTELTYYLPMHATYKPTSDASAKSQSGTFLNDVLLVGHIVYPPLFDIPLRFRTHAIALTADITKMYRA